MKCNVLKYQRPAQPLNYSFTPEIPQLSQQELRKRIWAEEVAESKERAANNTTSEFLYGKPNLNVKMGLEIVSPEFMLMTGGVGGLANKATTALGKIGQTALYGGAQGAIANAANISGSKQNLKGLATDVLGGALIGGGLKGIGLGVQNIPGIGKDAPELGFHALNKNH